MNSKFLNIPVLFLAVVIIAVAIFFFCFRCRYCREDGEMEDTCSKVVPFVENPKTTEKLSGNIVKKIVASAPTRKETRPEVKIIDTLATVDVPEHLKLIVGMTDDMSYAPRLKAVHALGRNLSGRERQTLLAFLHKKQTKNELTLLDFNAIKNDIMTVLMEQNIPCKELPHHLVAIYHSKSLDRVIRDYTVQFMGQIYTKIADPIMRAKVVKALNKAATENDGIAGTALIAMSRIGEPEFKDTDIAEIAFVLCKDKESADIVKVTALQICAKYRKPELLPFAREIAKKSSSVPLKMSAIAVIGTMGQQQDYELLQSFTKSTDLRLRTAAKSALKRLDF